MTPVTIQSKNRAQSAKEILKDVSGGYTLFMLRVSEDDITISDEWTHVVKKKDTLIKTRHPLHSNDNHPLDFSKAQS